MLSIPFYRWENWVIKKVNDMHQDYTSDVHQYGIPPRQWKYTILVKYWLWIIKYWQCKHLFLNFFWCILWRRRKRGRIFIFWFTPLMTKARSQACHPGLGHKCRSPDLGPSSSAAFPGLLVALVLEAEQLRHGGAHEGCSHQWQQLIQLCYSIGH